MLAETQRFSPDPEMAIADVDLGRIRQERMRTNTFGEWCSRTTTIRITAICALWQLQRSCASSTTPRVTDPTPRRRTTS